MQLTYRGVAYQFPVISVELPVSTQTGKYRGQIINISSTILVSPEPIALKYRGVAYPLIQPNKNATYREAIAVSASA